MDKNKWKRKNKTKVEQFKPVFLCIYLKKKLNTF